MTSLDDVVFVKRKSEYIEAFDFEVFDIREAVLTVRKYRPILYIIIGIYLLGIYLGQKWMKGRRAFELRIPLFLWNLSLAVFSIVSTLRWLPEVLYVMSQEDGIYQLVCTTKIHNFATSFWLRMFFLSKIVELGDTAFIILRKQKLIALHWFHHVASLLLIWVGYESQDPVGRLMVMNVIVHSFMYFYYSLKALKIKIPKRFSKALTSLQIVQLITGIFFAVRTANFLAKGRECRMNKEVIHLGIAVMGIVTVLFINFFRKTYSRKHVKTQKSE